MVKGSDKTLKEKLNTSIKAGEDRLKSIRGMLVALKGKIEQLIAEKKAIKEQIEVHKADLAGVKPAKKKTDATVTKKKKGDKGW